MTVEIILFLILALVAVVSAIGMILSQSAVYAALFLIMNFSTVAVYYVMLHAPFIALTQVSVYAGAIMVLFLFVIMLLGAERLSGRNTLRWQRPLAISMGVILLVEAGYVLLFRVPATQQANIPSPVFGSPEVVGLTLFTQYLLPFEVVSILLLVGIIGAVVLTKRAR